MPKSRMRKKFDIFCFDDLTAIRATNITQNSIVDRLAWNLTTDGKNSVISRYHYWNLMKTTMPQIPRTNGWNMLWCLSLPHKIKIFLWRFCINTIPMRNVLRTKGVAVPIICPFCMSSTSSLTVILRFTVGS